MASEGLKNTITMSCKYFFRRDKFARERPGPRELRRPPSPPSPYWRPPPSRPPPRAFPYPPPSGPREVSSITLVLQIHGFVFQGHLKLSSNMGLFVHLIFSSQSSGTTRASIPLWQWESPTWRRRRRRRRSTSKQETKDSRGNQKPPGLLLDLSLKH